MYVLRRRPVAITYWIAALVLSVWAGVGVARWGVGMAESDGPDGEATTNGAQIVYGIVGFALGLLGVIAIFSAIWLILWAKERRGQLPEPDDDDGEIDDILVDEDGERFD